jgi:hypothetical protein
MTILCTNLCIKVIRFYVPIGKYMLEFMYGEKLYREP